MQKSAKSAKYNPLTKCKRNNFHQLRVETLNIDRENGGGSVDGPERALHTRS